MEEILKLIPYADYQEFRKLVMEKCGWNAVQFRNRRNGRTPLSSLEIEGLRVVAREFVESKQ